MTETERLRLVSKMKVIVHQKFDENTYYNSSLVRDNTNCYAYAIGSTLPFQEINLIGAVSGKTVTDRFFFSAEEIRQLLYEDLNLLDLKIEESSEEEKINDNQYKIALYIQVYADGKIHDYHFLRLSEGWWTEKYRMQTPKKLDKKLKNIYNNWPWKFAGIFKITK